MERSNSKQAARGLRETIRKGNPKKRDSHTYFHTACFRFPFVVFLSGFKTQGHVFAIRNVKDVGQIFFEDN